MFNYDTHKSNALFENMPLAYTIFKVGTEESQYKSSFFYANNLFLKLFGLINLNLSDSNAMDYLPVKYKNTYYLTATTGEKKTFYYYNHTIKKYLKVFCYQPIFGHCACLIDDVTEQFNLQQLLKIRARSDSLTGLFNKEATHNYIVKYLENKKNRKHNHAMIILDLDNFKEINDYYGHIYGDALLLEISNRIKSLFRDTDIVGRIGGDEFMIFMKNIKKEENVLKKSLDLCYLINEKYKYYNTNLEITTSVGIALFPESGQDFATLYNNADVALYRAKEKGKNMYYVYDNEEEKNDYGKIVEYNKKTKKNTFVDCINRILQSPRNPIQNIQDAIHIVCDNYGFSNGYLCDKIINHHSYKTVCAISDQNVLYPDQSNHVLDCIGRFDSCYLTKLAAKDLLEEYGSQYQSLYFYALCFDGYVGFIGYCNIEMGNDISPDNLGELTVVNRIIANYYIETKYKTIYYINNRTS